MRGWGLEVEGRETQRGPPGASGALKTSREIKEQESFHWARNKRREPGKRANKLDN